MAKPPLEQGSSFSNEELAGELHRLGVSFVRAQTDPTTVMPLPPIRLLAALATSDEARLRLAIIPLLLVHPVYAAYARTVAAQLPPPARLHFQCYYTAALLLQQLHTASLQSLFGPVTPLPDLFATELGVPVVGPPAQRLATLAARQATLSGEPINWLGTYQHAAERLLRHVERLRVWAG